MVIVASAELEEALLSKEAIHGYYKKAHARFEGLVDGAISSTTTVGRSSKDCEGWFRARIGGRDILWIPRKRESYRRA